MHAGHVYTGRLPTRLGEAHELLAQGAEHGAVRVLAAHGRDSLVREALCVLEDDDAEVHRLQALVALLLREAVSGADELRYLLGALVRIEHRSLPRRAGADTKLFASL